jgi:hypothetical protein
MMLDWDWKDRSTKWLKRRLQYVKDDLDVANARRVGSKNTSAKSA